MNILIVKLSAIGDVIHTLPALNAIRRHYPGAHISWLIEEAAADLIAGHPALDRILVSKRKRWIKDLKGRAPLTGIKEIWRFLKELRGTRYDLIIDFQALLKSGILIALARGARKVGFGKGMQHMEHSYLFLTERIPAVSMEVHALERGLMLVEALGIVCKQIEYDLPIARRERESVNKRLQRAGLRSEDALVAVNPVAKWATKLWDNRKFGRLADRIIEKYRAAVVFTGGPDDTKAIGEIRSHMTGHAADLAGKTTLKHLAAVYEKADLVISTDTGPMHLAAAVGTPVVGLFGPTAPWRTGPFGKRHRVVRRAMPCSPCFKRDCDTRACMKEIEIDQVLAEIEKLGILQRRIQDPTGRN